MVNSKHECVCVILKQGWLQDSLTVWPWGRDVNKAGSFKAKVKSLKAKARSLKAKTKAKAREIKAKVEFNSYGL